MPNLICAQCKKLTPRTGNRQNCCPDCRAARRRAAGAERERKRRAAQADVLNERRREQYAANPVLRKSRIESAINRKRELRDDPATLADLAVAEAAATRRHREKTHFGGNWKRALDRDNRTCQQCGAKPETVHVHHIDGLGSNLPPEQQNNELENLVTLCASCHARVHREREAAARADKGAP